MKKFSAATMLEGACHDALRLLRDGDVKGAYKILSNKLNEIKKYEEADYVKVSWR